MLCIFCAIKNECHEHNKLLKDDAYNYMLDLMHYTSYIHTTLIIHYIHNCIVRNKTNLIPKSLLVESFALNIFLLPGRFESTSITASSSTSYWIFAQLFELAHSFMNRF